MKWVAPAGGAYESYTLLNAGGTTLTGATTITISGISNKNKFLVFVRAASSANASSYISLRINGDTGGNYDFVGNLSLATSTYGTSTFQVLGGTATTSIYLARMSNNAGSEAFGSCAINGGRSTGTKQFQVNGASTLNSGNNAELTNIQGFYAGSAAITSISVVSSSGNFDDGTVFVYGSDS